MYIYMYIYIHICIYMYINIYRFLDEPVVKDIEQFRRDIRSNKCEFSDDLIKLKDLSLVPSSSAGGGKYAYNR
jgi:hypothetical protein